ncbi:MAG: glycosyltransferase family 39 protein [Verrucomicrobiota bacterium]
MTKTSRILLGILYAYAILALGTSLLWPMGRDQGVFAWVGDVITKGGAPYVNAWEQKGPATQYTYAATQCLFGRTLWGIRALDAGILVITLAALWTVIRHITNATFAHFGVIFFLFQYLDGGYWHTAQPDGWASMLIIIAFALSLQKSARGLIPILVGVLLAWAVSYKFLYGAFLLPFAYLIWKAEGETARGKLTQIALMAGSFAIATGATLAWLHSQNALGEYLNIQWVFNRVNHQSGHARSLISRGGPLFCFLLRFGTGLPFLFYGIFTSFQKNEKAIVKAILLSGAIGVLIVLLQNKYYPYHWLPVYFSMVALTTLGIDNLRKLILERTENHSNNSSAILEKWVYLAFTIVILDKSDIASHRYVADIPFIRSAITTPGLIDKHFSNDFSGDAEFSFSTQYRLAKYIREKTTRADKVLTWGFDPLINWLSDRDFPARFGMHHPLIADPTSAICKHYRSEFIREISLNPPLYIIVSDKDNNNLSKDSSKQLLLNFPEFKALFFSHYQMETTLGDFELWRRKKESKPEEAIPRRDETGAAASPPKEILPSGNKAD